MVYPSLFVYFIIGLIIVYMINMIKMIKKINFESYIQKKIFLFLIYFFLYIRVGTQKNISFSTF